MDNLLSIDYKDWFINQKRIPDKESSEAKEFFEFHKKLCTEGCLMNGEFINPFLMWHLNFWHTEVDVIDEKGYISQKYINPPLRDNEWIITNAIDTANKERKGLVIAGSRRIAKSTYEASYIGWGATFDENSQNVIAGLNSPDIKLITDKLDKGLNYVPWYYKWDRIEDNWKQQVSLGIKSKTGERYPFSYILIRNLDDGNNEEAIAGTKPRKLIIDEALHEDSLLYTSTGEIKIKDVQVGQKIFGADGKLTKVIDKINPGIVDTFKVRLLDGREVIASDNHLWTVWNVYRKKWLTLTTAELREKLFFEKRDERYNKTVKSYIYSLPINKCLEYQKQNLPIDPYWLGLWLGDGLSSNTSVCSIDKDIIEYCKEYAKKLRLNYSIRENIEGKHKDFKYCTIINQRGKNNVLRDKLRELSIWEDKNIPDIYLYSSEEQRLELLRGLMDTDGCCYTKGHVEFTSSIPKLAKSFEQLVRSLGIQVKVKQQIPTYSYKGEKKNGVNNWKFSLRTDKNIFKLKRKLDFIKSIQTTKCKKQKAFQDRISIIDIVPYKKAQTYCIKVDNDSKLFLTDNFIVTHNCAKGNFLKALMAAIPGFTTPYGWGCSPICTFTGGDARKFNDAKQLMFDGASFNFLEFTDQKDSSKKHGLFMGHKYRLEAKIQSSLGEYINNPSLVNVPMMVADEEKADKITDEILERTKKSSDRATYLKEKMYYPKTVDDIFLNEDTNLFDVELAKRQKARLLSEGHTGTPVTLHLDENGNVYHKFTDKFPITNFPLKPSDNKDAPIVIYEFPIENPPYGLYVSGVDSYRVMKAAYSDSLGSIYIYKRMTSIIGESYQDMLVASYAARPDKKETWNEQARLLIKYYNARTLVENDEISFIDYMISKGDARYLEPQPAWMREIVPNSTVNRDYGIHRSAEKIRDFLHECLKKYMEEVIYVEKDEEGHIIKEVLGVSRIQDVMLLEEIIQFTEDGNFDRIVSSELAIALAMKLDPLLGVVGEGTRTKASYIKREKPPLFVGAKNTFSKNRQRLFT